MIDAIFTTDTKPKHSEPFITCASLSKLSSAKEQDSSRVLFSSYRRTTFRRRKNMRERRKTSRPESLRRRS
jgi:hypothetical protein